jgi:integral membrane protein
LLFVAYVVIATLIKPKLHWNLTTFAMIILASLVPFGTFYMEKKYLK